MALMNLMTLLSCRAQLCGYLLLPVGLLSAADAPDTSRTVPQGARVALTFAVGPRFVLGDVVQMTFTLSNAGPETFTYETGGDYRGAGFPTRYKFEVFDENQKALRTENWAEMGGLSSPRELKPGDTHNQILRLQNYVRVDRPGAFTLRVVHDFGWKTGKEKPLPMAEGKITIVLPTPEQAANRVRAIAAPSEPLKEHELGADWHKTEFRYLNHPVFLAALESRAQQGVVNALEGIHRIESQEATRALVRLLSGSNSNVVHAAALFLSRRMPLRMVDGHPRTFGWYSPPEQAAAYAALWLPEAGEPLRATAEDLLRSGDVNHVRTGAFIIESIGTRDNAAAVLEALRVALEKWQLRTNPDDNILDAPGAGNAIINALAGLRERGYRAPGAGGIEVIMARFLELAEPKIPRRAGWEQTLEAFFTQNPPMLREAAVRALPNPLSEKWEKLLLEALNDRDRGVMREACITAGKSQNPRFTEPLANIVRTEQHPWVVRAASEALTQIGSHWAATDAWLERLADERMYYEGLGFLADKLAHPKSGGSSGRTDMPREGRVAMRQKWQRFFSDEKRRSQVQSGKAVPVTEEQARDLFSGVFYLTVEGGKNWPAEK